MQNRRKFLGLLAGAAGTACLPEFFKIAAETNKKPNIVLFYIDDLGWGDFGCYGDKFHETPNIDRLAADGLKFTNAYAAAPVCSPSRASLMTGQYPARLHLTQWIPGTIYPNKKLLEPKQVQHLERDVPTIAERLKALGYKTAAFGKWHLGGDGYLPENFGFDVNVGGDNHGSPPLPNHYFGPFVMHNLGGYTKDDYLTEVLTKRMDDFLEHAARSGPFFLYMAEYAVHIPLEEREALIEKYRRKNGGKDEPDPVYAAMVESVDTALGNLREKLERLGVADNTLIILTSDNGGVGYQGRQLHRIADNGGLRAGKGYLYEGGIREPFLVYWPRVTKAGTVSDIPVIATDVMPTLLRIAGAGSVPAVTDGVDITEVIRGSNSLHREALYWHYPHYSDQGGTPSSAIREGEWKLIEFLEDGHTELYNLTLDPGEQYDFSSSFSDKAKDLLRKLHTWRERVNAAMPQPNPDYNPTLASLRTGSPGCSWNPTPGCKED